MYQKFSFKTKKGTIDNADLNGKVVFINFWHSQCAPCLAEMAALNNTYDSFSVNPGFKFISFTFNDEKTIRTTKAKSKLSYTTSGNVSQRTFGRHVRKVNMTRGGRQGNNAFLNDYNLVSNWKLDFSFFQIGW